MKNLLSSLFISIAFSLSISAQNINVGGNISTNTTWDAASIDTVKIIGNTTIDSTIILTIEPGIVIDFTDNFYFNIKGRVIAEGTVTDSITFTTSDTSGFYNNTHHGWSGIRIHDRQFSSDTIVFEYCIVEFGKADGSFSLPNATNGGGIYTYSSFKTRIANSSFRNNFSAGKGGALYDYNSFIYSNNDYLNITSCNFVNNTSVADGGAIYTGNSFLDIYNCLFKQNTSTTGKGGAIRDGGTFSYVGVYQSRFSYNKAKNGGAIVFTVATSSLTHSIKQSFFNNNTAFNGVGGAMQLSNIASDIQNNVFVNNEASSSGGAIYFFNTFSSVTNTLSMFANNTLAHNKALNGGGIYLFDNTNPGYDLFFNKTIFYNNETVTTGENEDIGLGAQPSNSNNPRFYSCSFTNDLNNTGIWTGYIYSGGSLFNINPLFVNPSTGIGASFDGFTGRNWSLDCNSPCIDVAGQTLYVPDTLDYKNSPRMINDTIDIGAYEAYDFLTLPQSLEICEGDTAVFSATFYAPSADIANSYWSFSQDNGVNWWAVTNYTENWVYSTNAPASANGDLIRLEIDLGCGLIITDPVTLTVHPKAFTQETIIACDSYFIGGALQTVSGTYYDTLNTVYGCDSIVETSLTINSSYFNSSTIDICQGDSALIFGNYEMLDSLYTDSLQTIAGCDSVYHVQLNVHPTYVMNENATICSNDSIYLQGAWQNTMNFYYDTLQTPSSCDSVIITFLTINSVSSATLDTSFCAGTSVTINGTTYNQSGVFTQNFTNSTGCDSTLTINVTENALPSANIGPDTLLVCDGEVLGFGLDDTTDIVNYTIGNFTTLATNDSLIFTYDALNAPSSVVSQVTDINGCVNNDQVILQNNAIQYLQIGLPTFYDPFIDFTIANMPNNVDSWYWSFGDGDTLSGNVAPTHEYLANGSYQACLIGENMCGIDSSCMTFDIFTVGISENNINNNMSIYPNPAQNQLTIKTDNLKLERVELLDVRGKIVKTITQNYTTIDVSNLQKGVYFVKTYTDKGVGNQRFIKN